MEWKYYRSDWGGVQGANSYRPPWRALGQDRTPPPPNELSRHAGSGPRLDALPESHRTDAAPDTEYAKGARLAARGLGMSDPIRDFEPLLKPREDAPNR